MNNKYNINNKIKLYDGFFQLHELNFSHVKHNGDWNMDVKREIFSGAEVATVIPYDPIKKKILLLKQFRAGVISKKYDPILTEIVAGIVDPGESPEQAAKRECFEETGCIVNNLTKINSYFPAPGSSESYFHLFLAEIDSFDGEKIFGLKNENEDILVKSYSIDEVKDLLFSKKIFNGVTIIALQWFFLEFYKD